MRLTNWYTPSSGLENELLLLVSKLAELCKCIFRCFELIGHGDNLIDALYIRVSKIEDLQWIKQKATVKERKAFKAQVKSIEEEIESLDTELFQLTFQGITSLSHVTEGALLMCVTLLVTIYYLFC